MSVSLIKNDEHEYTTTIYGLKVMVSKVGGGAVGQPYGGEDWIVTVMNGDVFIYDNDVVYVGTPRTHRQVAREAAWFASERIG